jgi:putative transcriptional regulator
LTELGPATENRAVPNSVTRSAAAVALSCGLGLLVPLTLVAGRPQGLGDALHRRVVKALAVGKLLVASRNLSDPNFANTVVLLADVSREGAMGLVVNRPTTVTLARLFPALERTLASASTAFLGGPVPGPGALALLRGTTAPATTRRIVAEVHLVNSRAVLEEMIGAGAPASRFRVYLGYAGWGPGQLEDETAKGAWRVLEGDADVVFDADPRAMWRRLIVRTEALSASNSRVPAPQTMPAPRWTLAGRSRATDWR